MSVAQATLPVAVVEDDRRTREGLARLIDGTPGYRCVGSWGSVEEAVLRRAAEAPQVILLDIDLPGISGAEGVAQLRDRHPQALVLMLTVYDDDEKIFTSLCNGASGYLLKTTPPARLLEAIREAQGGGAPLSPEIAAKVIRLFRQHAPPSRVEERLSPQELRLLALLAEGHTYQTAADELGITIHTVRNHIRSIYDKLHVHSKSAAVARALKAGLL
jgi:DNA-binding NarL/FixJ family response regulator